MCSEERPWNKPSSTQLWPGGGPARGEHTSRGGPGNALAMETSSPDKAGTRTTCTIQVSFLWPFLLDLHLFTTSNNGSRSWQELCKGCCWSSTLASIRTYRGNSHACHLQQTWLGGPCELLELTVGNSLVFTIRIQDFSSILQGRMCAC